jgi:hypothetical protein
MRWRKFPQSRETSFVFLPTPRRALLQFFHATQLSVAAGGTFARRIPTESLLQSFELIPPMPTTPKREKNWKQLDLRSEKLARAKQLGMDCPRVPDGRLADEPVFTGNEPLKILFICSRNQWRSPTAERIWHRY